MSLICTAPVRGHHSPTEVARCPFHGAAGRQAATPPILAPPSLPLPRIVDLDDPSELKNTTDAERLRNAYEEFMRVPSAASMRGYGHLGAIINNRHTPTDVLVDFVFAAEFRGYDWLQEDAVQSARFPKELLPVLAEDEHVSQRVVQAVAMRRVTPPESLVKLAARGDRVVTQMVAGNPNTPRALLVTLCETDDQWTLTSVVGNKNLPLDKAKEVWRRYRDVPEPTDDEASKAARYTRTSVGVALARRKDLDDETLTELIGDETHSVRGTAMKNPLTTADRVNELLFSEPNGYVIGALAKMPAITRESLERAMGSSDPRVRKAICANPAMTIADLASLRDDARTEVRDAVTKALPKALRREFDIDPRNKAALEYVMAGAWWDLPNDDTALKTSLILWANP